MSVNPWLKFYPADWQADQALRLCSLAARGMWIECMCIMHRAVPYGHLVVNGRPVTDTQLAVLAGAHPSQIPDLIRELEEAGVFSRTKQGVIYSRRLSRDAKRSAIGRKTKIDGMMRAAQLVENEQENSAPSRSPCRGASPQKPEARIQIEKKGKGKSFPEKEIPDGFGEFWAAYPRKVGRPAAERSYRAALKGSSPAEILAGAHAYAEQRSGQDQTYTAHPSTWLNQRRWQDDAVQGFDAKAFFEGKIMEGTDDR